MYNKIISAYIKNLYQKKNVIKIHDIDINKDEIKSHLKENVNKLFSNVLMEEIEKIVNKTHKE